MTRAVTLPDFALSVRQPWAWAIIHAGKDIENRMWKRPNPGLNFRGPVCIHASKGMTQNEYRDANVVIGSASKTHAHSPSAHELSYGYIIGTVDIIDVVKVSESKWFQGPFAGLVGLVLANPQPIDPIRVSGALGFFNWRERINHSVVPGVLPKWMFPKPDPELDQFDILKPEPQGSLL
jgi:hypothetical protein